MRCTKGSTANTVMNDRVILTEFDSSNHTYKSICVIKETAAAMRENSPGISVVRKRGALRPNARGTLTVPHDPYPRAFGPVALQQVQCAAVEQALLYGVPFAGGAHGEFAELVREDESADRRAHAEKQREIREYQEGVLRAGSDASVEIRFVFNEGEEVDLDDCK